MNGYWLYEWMGVDEQTRYGREVWWFSPVLVMVSHYGHRIPFSSYPLTQLRNCKSWGKKRSDHYQVQWCQMMDSGFWFCWLQIHFNLVFHMTNLRLQPKNFKFVRRHILFCDSRYWACVYKNLRKMSEFNKTLETPTNRPGIPERKTRPGCYDQHGRTWLRQQRWWSRLSSG